MMKTRKCVLIGISSGIAAYKVLELISLLKAQNLDVVVMMTNHATQMVDPKEFERATGHEVYVHLYSHAFNYKDTVRTRHVDHIDLADRADLLVLVPATANLIGKLATGIADDFVTTTTLAVTCPILIFPSMNSHMWSNPVVMDNVQKLKNFGYRVIDPSSGPLACGYEGKGRLPEVADIGEQILSLFQRKTMLAGKRVLITAGGTQEKIDEVRFVANRSSGKMGAALADVAWEYGADVIFFRAEQSVTPRHAVQQRVFTSSADLYSLMQKEVPNVDIVVHTAAVSDFSVSTPIAGKLSSTASYSLSLTPQKKILDSIKQWNTRVFLVGFKAEYGLSETELVNKTRQRLNESRADLLIANDIATPDRGFQADTNEVIIVSSDTATPIPLTSKRVIAQEIFEHIVQHLKRYTTSV